MNPTLQQLAALIASAFKVFSDKVVFSKNIQLERGRHINCVYVGRVNSGVAGTPFPAGWTCAANGTGNYTVTHNLKRTDYSVQLTFIDSDANNIDDAGISVDPGSNSFTVDLNRGGFDFDTSFFFAVLI
jgi:hypothetical protein